MEHQKSNNSYNQALSILENDRKYTLKQVQDAVISKYTIDDKADRGRFKDHIRYIARKLADTHGGNEWTGPQWREMINSTGTFQIGQVPEKCPEQISDEASEADQTRGRANSKELPKRFHFTGSHFRLTAAIFIGAAFLGSVAQWLILAEWSGTRQEYGRSGSHHTLRLLEDQAETNDQLYARAWLLMEYGELDQSETIAHTIQPDDGEFGLIGRLDHLYASILYKRDRDPREKIKSAIENFSKVGLKKNIFLARTLLVRYHLLNKNIPEAELFFKETPFPKTPDFQAVYFRHKMLLEEAKGNDAQALDYGFKSAALFKNEWSEPFIEINRSIGAIYARSGNYDKGLEYTVLASNQLARKPNTNGHYKTLINRIYLARLSKKSGSAFRESIEAYVEETGNRYLLKLIEPPRFGDYPPTDDEDTTDPKTSGDYPPTDDEDTSDPRKPGDLPTEAQSDPVLRPITPKKAYNPKDHWEAIYDGYRTGSKTWEEIRNECTDLKSLAPNYNASTDWLTGLTYKKEGRYELALEYLDRAIRGSDNQHLRIIARGETARIWLIRKEPARARLILEEAQGMADDLGKELGKKTRAWLDHVQHLSDREASPQNALAHCEQALIRARRTLENDRIADALINRGSMRLLTGDQKGAHADTVSGMEFALRAESPNQVIYGWINLAALGHDRYEEAVKAYALYRKDHDIIAELDWWKERIGF